MLSRYPEMADVHQICEEANRRFPDLDTTEGTIREYIREYGITPLLMRKSGSGRAFLYGKEAQEQIYRVLAARQQDKYIIALRNLRLEQDIKKLEEDVQKLQAQLATYEKLQKAQYEPKDNKATRKSQAYRTSTSSKA